jgi:hypothetical protein
MRKLSLIVVASFLAMPAQAATFGDVVIDLELKPEGSSNQGSNEYVFGVRNESATQGHRVTLIIPNEAGYGNDRLISVSRTVDVRPKESARVSLLYPFFPPISGSGVKVIIDGRTYGTPALPAIPLALPGAGSYMRGGRADQPLVLVSPEVSEEFFIRGQNVINEIGHVVAQNQIEVAKTPLAGWSTNWQGYTRYDAVVVPARAWKAAPENVRSALWQYAETGGFLVFLEPVPLPAAWNRTPQLLNDVKIYLAGFGSIAVVADDKIGTWMPARWAALYTGWSRSGQARGVPNLTAQEANNRFPVVDDVQIPVRGLFILMVVFTIVIGPGNLWLLARMRRRIWMLWTVPCIAFLTCAAVFGYMLIAEGWRGESRIEAITVLDEADDRATSVAWVGLYSPMTPSDGLHFSLASEVLWLKQREEYGYGYRSSSNTGSSCTIDLTTDQHLANGWVSARVPSHFKLRKSESAQHRRVSVDLAPDGSLTATNALGADIQHLWVADEKGAVYSAEAIPAGAKAALTPLGRAIDPGVNSNAVRFLLTNDSWLTPKQVRTRQKSPVPMKKTAVATMAAWPGKGGPGIPPVPPPAIAKSPAETPDAYLRPRGYVAVLDSAPFIENPLANTRASEAKSTVIGYMKPLDAAQEK